MKQNKSQGLTAGQLIARLSEVLPDTPVMLEMIVETYEMHPKTGDIECVELGPKREILRGHQVLFPSSEGSDSSPLAIMFRIRTRALATA